VADIDADTGRETVVRLGSRAAFIETDVTSDDSVQAAIAFAKSTFGGLHGVVNCAGILVISQPALGRDGPHPLDTFIRVQMVNLVGTFNVIRLGAATMAANDPDAGGERGVIVTTASVAAFDGQVGQCAYAASKGGIVAMTLPLAREFSRIGVRVMTIAPGIFDTPMLRSIPHEARQSLGAKVPFPPRLGHPDEYGRLVREIVENTMLNGEVIRLDGAIRLAPK
jgi:NAD(P)-dependent dehydrogenase (short-subunit alcohol dehydrogenase family)